MDKERQQKYSQDARYAEKVKKEKKQQLMKLLEEMELHEDTINEDTIDKIEMSINKANQIMNITDKNDIYNKSTNVILMDANILKSNYDLLAKAFESTSVFDEDAFAAGFNKMSWEDIVKETCSIGRTLYGTPTPCIQNNENYELLQKKTPVLHKKTKVDEVKHPLTIKKIDNEEEDSKEIDLFQNKVIQIFKQNGNEPIPYYKLVINPQDFMKSVRNGYLLSFLLQSGIIVMNALDKKYPSICLMTPEYNKTLKVKQLIITWSYDIYEEMIKFYNIKEAMIDINYDDAKYEVVDDDDDKSNEDEDTESDDD